MFLITCMTKDAETDLGWLSAMSTSVEQVQITTTRSKVRRFRRQADAIAVRDLAVEVAPDYVWTVVSADADW